MKKSVCSIVFLDGLHNGHPACAPMNPEKEAYIHVYISIYVYTPTENMVDTLISSPHM